MKYIRLVTFLLTYLLSSAVSAQDKPLSLFSFEDTSCGTWVKTSGSATARAQYHSWFRGFVSGYNFGRPDSQVNLGRMPDEQTLFLYVDKFCRENPLNPFVGAAFKLVEELRDPPPQQSLKSRK